MLQITKYNNNFLQEHQTRKTNVYIQLWMSEISRCVAGILGD